MTRFFLPLLLSRIGLTISVPVFFISDAVHCILHANTCNLSRKYLHPSLQVLATAPASTCGKRRHYIGISSLMFFYGAVLLSLPTLFPDQLIVELLAEEVGPSHLYLHCVAQVITMV